MKTPDFVHLHVHSDYSLLDGACRVDRLAEAAAEDGMKRLALTDHGSLFGALSFYSAAGYAGVTPIIGYEAYVAPGPREERSARSQRDAATHLTLLAQNLTGYYNLVKLASEAYLTGFYYRPRIDKQLLADHSEGLICLSGCASGEMSRLVEKGDRESALNLARFYRDLFGPERFYIEIQDNGLEIQRKCMRDLAEIAKELALRPVATNDTHYMTRQDAAAHEALLCISTGKTLQDDGRMRLGSDEFYFKSRAEMAERFKWIPDAIRSTVDIAERCNVTFDFSERHFPRFVPEDGRSDVETFKELCWKGARERYGEVTDAVRSRLEMEMDVIISKGYASYFLISWDLSKFIREQRIPHGLRGSGCGSIVTYVLHISDIDPIREGLLFERFMAVERTEDPDLDFDICEARRDEVIAYVKRKYGDDHSAQIITFGTLAAKAAVRDVGRVMDMPLADVDRIAKLIPGGPGVKLQESLESEPDLKRLYEEDPRVHKLIDTSLRLEGLCRHASTHAAGMVLADQPLVECIPLYKNNDMVMSQYAMEDLEKAGMLKLDLLGLRTLTIMDRALDLVEEDTGERPDMETLPLDDEKTYQFLATQDTRSVFQLGSEGIQELLHRMEPGSLLDVKAVVALYRPGPLQSGLVDDFIERKHGRAEIEYLHPSLQEFLEETYGVIVFQEQIMLIAHKVAGMGLDDALTMIKAISKKKEKLIEERRERFMDGAVANGLDRKTAEAIFDYIGKFAQYGFNKAHTTAYAHLAYKTGWLKAHYPVQFVAAAMTCEMQYSDKIVSHMDECRALGIEVLPPSVNRSRAQFTVEDGTQIRYGLGAVRNAGLKAMEALVEARERVGQFKSLHHFCEEVDLHRVNKSAVESLVKAGAFDALHPNRAAALAAVEDAMKAGQVTQRDRRAGQASFFGELAGEAKPPAMPAVPEWPRLQQLEQEKDALGFYLSGHPLDDDRWIIERFASHTTVDGAEMEDGGRVVMGGMIRGLRTMFDKRGNSMAHFVLEDLCGTMRCVLFSDSYANNAQYVVEGDRVFVIGNADARTERVSVRVDEVIPMRRVPQRLCERVRIHVNGQAERQKRLEELRALLGEHPGACPIDIDVQTNGRVVTIRASRNFYVSPSSDFIDAARRLLGEESLELVPEPDPQPRFQRNGWGGKNGGRRHGG